MAGGRPASAGNLAAATAPPPVTDCARTAWGEGEVEGRSWLLLLLLCLVEVVMVVVVVVVVVVMICGVGGVKEGGRGDGNGVVRVVELVVVMGNFGGDEGGDEMGYGEIEGGGGVF